MTVHSVFDLLLFLFLCSVNGQVSSVAWNTLPVGQDWEGYVPPNVWQSEPRCLGLLQGPSLECQQACALFCAKPVKECVVLLELTSSGLQTLQANTTSGAVPLVLLLGCL